MTLGFGAIGEFAVSAIPDSVLESSGGTTIYLSSHGFTTAASDTPASTHFVGAISMPPVIEQTLGQSGFFGGQAVRTVGRIDIVNADGSLDAALRSFAVDGRRAVVKVTPITRDENGQAVIPDFKKFDTFFDGSALGWDYTERGVRLEFRSNDFLLTKTVQRNLYAGTGLAEGGSDLAGQPKPLLLGECENVTPVLLKSTAVEDDGNSETEAPYPDTDLLFQVHDGRIESLDAVYDGGSELVKGKNYPDFTKLNSATTVPGAYDTCRALGLFKLATQPVYAVTCDARGDAKGGYIDTVGAIIRRLVVNAAEVPKRLVKGGSFASFEARQPAKIGIFINQALTVAAVLDLLVRGVSAYWGFAGDGRLRIGTISDPKGRKGELVGIDEILSIRRLNLPYKRPAFRISVGFRRNWTPNAGTLATAASKKQFRQSAIRIADAEDRTIKLRNLLAIDPPPIESHFAERSDAKAEAQRLLEIYGEMRVLYRIAIKTRGFTKDIGDIITIQHPRWGLAAGKPFLIVGIRCDTGRNRAELTCFG